MLTLLVRATVVAVLFACLKALGVHPTFQTMINTYFASIVAGAVIPLFGGAGAVEAVSILTLTQAGVPKDIAIGATLLWRFIDLWIPVGIGLLLHAKTELPAAIDETPVVAAKMVELRRLGPAPLTHRISPSSSRPERSGVEGPLFVPCPQPDSFSGAPVRGRTLHFGRNDG